MKEKNKNGKIILITGIISLIIVTVAAFNKELIIHKYYEYKINKNYTKYTLNEYYVEDNFNYIDNYSNTNIKNKEDLINYIYFTLNSGENHTERYIDINYTNYENDIKELTSNEGKELKEIISNINSFVHPYNSSNNIKLNYGGKYTIGLTITKTYSDEEITKINAIVNKVIREKIKNTMPAKEKIKIIHDYIIDNTEYDKLKYNNKNDTTYKSNTAYGVLVEGYGTCNGYADAMAIFLNKLNIINYKISNEEHIWNLVYLDGKWYHLDLTWDDPISETNVNRDTYFLINTDTLKKLNDGTHTFNKNIYSEAN